MSFSGLSLGDIRQKIRWDAATNQGAVIDIIKLVMDITAKHASNTWANIKKQFPEVSRKVSTEKGLKFRGQGQSQTPVANIATLIEIAWLCPGKHAKEFRRTGAVTLCRALGGDLSLVDEIRERHAEVAGTDEQEAFLAGTGVTVSEANGQAIVPHDDRTLAIEERRLALEERKFALEEMRALAEIRERRAAELADAATRLYESADATDDLRHKFFLRDGAKNMELHYIEVVGGKRLAIEGAGTSAPSPDAPITLAAVAAQAGHEVTRENRGPLGMVAARLYRQANGGANPPKHERFVENELRSVNSYFEKDRKILEEAVRTYFDKNKARKS